MLQLYGTKLLIGTVTRITNVYLVGWGLRDDGRPTDIAHVGDYPSPANYKDLPMDDICKVLAEDFLMRFRQGGNKPQVWGPHTISKMVRGQWVVDGTNRLDPADLARRLLEGNLVRSQ